MTQVSQTERGQASQADISLAEAEQKAKDTVAIALTLGVGLQRAGELAESGLKHIEQRRSGQSGQS